MSLQCRQPTAADGAAKDIAIAASLQGCVDDVGLVEIVQAIRIVGVLKTRAHHNFRVVLADVDTAIAVVNIEINNGYPLDSRLLQRV